MANRRILFFPGIAGNELHWQSRYLSSEGIVWYRTSRLAAGGLQWLILSPGGDEPYSTFSPIIRPGPPVDFYSADLLDFLRRQGHVVDSVVCDWRKRLEKSTQGVADYVRAWAKDGPITFLCHSRGGLLAQEVARSLAASGELDKIQEGIGLGVPWRGSYDPMGWLGGYAKTALTLNLIGWGLSLNASIVTKGWSIEKVCSTWPGLYELLPDPAYLTAVGDPGAGDVYNAFLYNRGGLSVSDFHLSWARDRWATNPTLPTGLKWTSIVGTGRESGGPLFAEYLPGTPQKLQHKVDGDGTVPLWSATAVGGPVLRTTESHSGMIGSPIVHGLIDGILQAG